MSKPAFKVIQEGGKYIGIGKAWKGLGGNILEGLLEGTILIGKMMTNGWEEIWIVVTCWE